MTKTTVYKVQLYDAKDDKPVISRRMATPEGADKMGGTIVEGTGYVIDLTDLEVGHEWTAIGFDPTALSYKKVVPG
jgi:hypothetical protein